MKRLKFTNSASKLLETALSVIHKEYQEIEEVIYYSKSKGEDLRDVQDKYKYLKNVWYSYYNQLRKDFYEHSQTIDKLNVNLFTDTSCYRKRLGSFFSEPIINMEDLQNLNMWTIDLGSSTLRIKLYSKPPTERGFYEKLSKISR